MSEPPLTAQQIVNALQPLIAGVMTNPLRQSGINCGVCTREVRPGYTLCWRCNNHRQTFSVPAQGWPHPVPAWYRTADVVAPLAYAVKGYQSYVDMVEYKNEAVPSGAARGRLDILAALFRVGHPYCIDKVVGVPVSGLAVLPSLKGRQGLHPLTAVTGYLPSWWQHVQLDPAAELPASQDDRREANPDFFHCPQDLHGRHVVLLDDLWVTGGHAQGAAVALRNAGALRVSILEMARLLDPGYPETGTFIRNYKLLHRPYNAAICPVTGGACPP